MSIVKVSQLEVGHDAAMMINTMGANGRPVVLEVDDILAVQGGLLTLAQGGGGGIVQGAGVLTRRSGLVSLDPLAIGGLLVALKRLGKW